MFDIGWAELLLIGIVALIVVGPKELPVLFRTAGRFMGRARAMAREFQRSMEQAADDSGLRGAADELRSINRLSTPMRTARDYGRSILKDPPAKAPDAPPPAPDSPVAADDGAPRDAPNDAPESAAPNKAGTGTAGP
jgi:sec-independent protein translocase protein TatB